MQLVNQKTSSHRTRLALCITILGDGSDNALVEFIQMRVSIALHAHTLRTKYSPKSEKSLGRGTNFARNGSDKE